MKNIGWIGLGNMGFPMALNLLSAKYNVNIHSRNQEKSKAFSEKGGRVCVSLPELTKNSDIVFLMLPDDDVCAEIIEQIKATDFAGKLIVNMSTISPEASVRFDTDLKKHNIRYVEAPVSGSVKPATEGTLVILAAGENKDLEEVSACFDVLGKKTFTWNTIGKGALAKLVVNYYMSIVVSGLADSVLFAEKIGLEDSRILDVINAGACASGMTQIKAQPIINKEFKPAFPLKYMYKDIRLGKDIGLNSPMGNLMLELYGEANKEFGDEDLMAIYSYIKKTEK